MRGFDAKPDSEGAKIFAATQKATPEKSAEMWLEHPLLAGVKNRPRERKKMLQLMTDNHKGYTAADAGKLYILPQPPTYQRLKNITAPTLVIIGDLDHPSLIEVSNVLKENIPGAQLKTMRDVSHHPNLENPKEFNQILSEFLRAKTN